MHVSVYEQERAHECVFVFKSARLFHFPPFFFVKSFRFCQQLQHFVCSSRVCVACTHVYHCTAVSKVFSTSRCVIGFFFLFFFKSPVHIQSVANVILSSGMCEDRTNCCSDPYSATDGRPFSYDSSQHFKCFKLFLSLETDIN